jgi:hypothetical protein
MAHTHSHEDQTTFYVEQIFTIGVCGAIAGVCLLLFFLRRPMLDLMLSADQHPRVLFGGIGLLCLVLIRAVYVWIAAGQTAAKAANANHNHNGDHNHDHDHGHADHDHAHCNHDHEHEHEQESLTMAGDHEHFHDHHGHEHGWAPWRYALLIVPVVLFVLNLPNQGKSADKESDIANQVGDVGNTAAKGDNFRIGFNQLERAARNEYVRENIAGTTVRLTGEFKGERRDSFTLIRYKRNCCAADAIALKAVIMIDPKLTKTGNFWVDPDKYRQKWVQITGRVEFSKAPNSNEYIPVILLQPASQAQLESEVVKEVPPDPNFYTYD